MKFDEVYNKIILEFSDIDWNEERRREYEIDAAKEASFNNDLSDVPYTWEHLNLGDDPNMFFDVTMTADWKIYSGFKGNSFEPSEPAEPIFKNGNEILYVTVHNGTEYVDEYSKDEFKEQFPKEYEEFMEDYFDTEPENLPEF